MLKDGRFVYLWRVGVFGSVLGGSVCCGHGFLGQHRKCLCNLLIFDALAEAKAFHSLRFLTDVLAKKGTFEASGSVV